MTKETTSKKWLKTENKHLMICDDFAIPRLTILFAFHYVGEVSWNQTSMPSAALNIGNY